MKDPLKSTALKLTAPTKPSVMPWHAKMGMLFQGGALFDSLSVWENVAFGLIENQKWNRKDAKNEAVRVLRQVGLAPDVADLSPSELSGGMQKRVSLARRLPPNRKSSFLTNRPRDLTRLWRMSSTI